MGVERELMCFKTCQLDSSLKNKSDTDTERGSGINKRMNNNQGRVEELQGKEKKMHREVEHVSTNDKPLV